MLGKGASEFPSVFRNVATGELAVVPDLLSCPINHARDTDHVIVNGQIVHKDDVKPETNPASKLAPIDLDAELAKDGRGVSFARDLSYGDNEGNGDDAEDDADENPLDSFFNG